jgi:hypothetical protein
MIPTEKIVEDLETLLKASNPGDSISHVFFGSLAAMPRSGDYRLLGSVLRMVITQEMAETGLAAIVAGGAQTHIATLGEIYLVALYLECYSVHVTPDNAAEVHRMKEEFILDRHDDTFECVKLYAADRTGRRYSATRHLTGPLAGVIDGIWIARGGPDQHVDGSLPIVGREVRKVVGLEW